MIAAGRADATVGAMASVWYGLGFLALAVIGTSIGVLRAFLRLRLRLRLRVADSPPLPAGAVPAGRRAALADEAAQLLPGIARRAWWRTVSLVVDDQRPLRSPLLQDGGGTWAALFPQGSPQDRSACAVMLATPRADGRIACTALGNVAYACFGGRRIVLTPRSGIASGLAADPHRVLLPRVPTP